MKKKSAEDIIRQYKSGYREFKGFTVDPPGNFAKTRLVGIILEGTHLMGASFERAILQRASFSAANLRGANFTGANLAKADFKGADLRGAVMRGVDLNGADFRWANLENADLTSSIISSANFDGANLKNTCLKDADPGKFWWKAKLADAKMDSTILPDGTVFSQPMLDEEPDTFIRESIGVAEPFEPAEPDYKKADRFYYEGLGDIAGIQAQIQSGLPRSHPKVQDLIRQASKKFAQAMEVSDTNWPRFAECEKYTTTLMADMKEKSSK